MVNRLAFTFIELIFAILIISIAVMSLPVLSSVTSKGIEDNIVQEAIFAASTELNQAVSYKWDENSTEGSSTISRVIWTSATDCNLITKRRPGHILQEKHRRCLDNNLTRPTHTSDADNDDLNDAAHSSASIYVTGSDATTAKGYKADYNSTITVTKDASFGTTANNPDIKKIRVRVFDSQGNTVTKLDTYSANIGEIDFHSEVY